MAFRFCRPNGLTVFLDERIDRAVEKIKHRFPMAGIAALPSP